MAATWRLFMYLSIFSPPTTFKGSRGGSAGCWLVFPLLRELQPFPTVLKARRWEPWTSGSRVSVGFCGFVFISRLGLREIPQESQLYPNGSQKKIQDAVSRVTHEEEPEE